MPARCWRPAQDFIARAGVPDIVIANAGISVGTLTGEREDLPAFRRVFETNVLGMVHTFHPFIAAMQQAGARPPGRHRLGGRHPRPAGRRRLLGLEGGGDRLSRKPARRIARQRRAAWSRWRRATSKRR